MTIPITAEYPPVTIEEFTAQTSTACDCEKCKLASALVHDASTRLGPLSRGAGDDHNRLLDEIAAHFEAGLVLVAYASSMPDTKHRSWHAQPALFATIMSLVFNHVLGAFAFGDKGVVLAAVTSGDESEPAPAPPHPPRTH